MTTSKPAKPASKDIRLPSSIISSPHSANDAADEARAQANCVRLAAASLVALSIAIGSVAASVHSIDHKISYAHGVCLLVTGFLFFDLLTRLCHRVLLRTATGRAFCGRHQLLRSDALEITNKLVSTIQAVTSCIAGAMVCSSSCRRSFLTASHYMSDAYAWFGCAYFVYDMWAMYEVHVQKIRDKSYLLRLLKANKQQQHRQQQESVEVDSVRQLRRSRSSGQDDTDGGKPESAFSDEQLLLMLKRLKQVSADQQPTFVRFCAANPVMTVHHIFLQSFGLFVIVYLRGNFGDCVYGFVYLMELSTPCVSLRSILSTLQLKSSRAYIVNGLLMLFTFFVCRVLMWPSLFYWYGQIVHLNIVQAVLSLPLTCKLGTAVLFLPQIYWFWLMIRGALQVFFPAGAALKRPASSKADDAAQTTTPTEVQQSLHSIH